MSSKNENASRIHFHAISVNYSRFENIVFDQFDYFGYVLVFQSIMATKSPMPFVLGM